MTGAHWYDTIQNMISNGSLKIFQASDLPAGSLPTSFTTINGHIKYENLYLKKPSGISSTGSSLVEVPPGSGNFYKPKPEQYVINPSWSEQKLREEMANAMANKMIDPVEAERIGGAKFGKSYNHITTYWNSEFSDGTPLGIITSNYGIDPVYNRIVDDHLNLLYIK